MESITTPPSLWSALPATKLPTQDNKTRSIQVAHINVRQSISFVILKLVILELVSATSVIIFHSLLFSTAAANIYNTIDGNFTLFNAPIFLILVASKTFLSLYIIVYWLNDYYEITPAKLVHKKGFFFKKEYEYVFSHIMSIDLQQSIWGRLFNYGSIHLYDRYINQHVQVYLIHNPKRYYAILKNLIPFTDTAREVTRGELIEDKEDEA